MRKVSVVLAVLMAFALSSFGQIPSQGLSMWCPFSGDNVDSIGNVTFVPQLIGTPCPPRPDRFSAADQARRFYDGSAYIALNVSKLPAGSSSRTISMWVNREASINPTSTFFFYGKKQPGKFLSFGLKISPNVSIFVRNGTDSLIVNAITSVSGSIPCFPSSTWEHIALVIKGDTTIFYHNGKEYGRKNITSWSTSTDSLCIGGWPVDNDHLFLDAFRGTMDDIAVYNKALSYTQIKRLYESGSFRNSPAKFTSIPDSTIRLGEQFIYIPTTDDSSVVSVDSMPTGMTYLMKKFTWTPTSAGKFRVALLATDNAGDTATQKFTITVDIATSTIGMIKFFSGPQSSQKYYDLSGRSFNSQNSLKVFLSKNKRILNLNR